ncbi:uncharacterized protein LOC129228584 [Uloborus diversus]|uniref:uncharacterized protein LOC129228584 n=1 Tax=Uloborus diversus TaxID=327109 RepID=UPI0024092C79|nr:uncharacterized protein LOC129228584 [Uloborus diversus]
MDLAKHESKISDVMGNLFKVRVERDKLQETYGNAEQDNAQRAIRVQQLEVELSMFIELKKKRKVDLGARAEVWDKLTAVTAENESLNVSIAEMNSTLNATNNALRKKRALHRHLLKIITDFAKALTARGTLTPSLKEKFSALNEELKLEYSNNPELEGI